MPCNQILENSVDLGTCDRSTLIDAIKDLGWTPIIVGDLISFQTEYGAVQIREGKVVMRGSGSDNAETVKNAVKQSVMATAIKKAGQKFGWKISHDKVANKIKLKRG